MPKCSICNDSGFILDNDDTAKPCPCTQTRLLENRVKSSRLTPRMRSFLFQDFSFQYYSFENAVPDASPSYLEAAKRAYRAAVDFCARVEQGACAEGLLMQGKVGSGKTFLACCIANRLLDRGHRVLFLVVPDFLDHIRSSYDAHGSGTSERDIMDEARDVPVLILDDLGAHQYTEWSRQKIYSLINYRMNHQLPVIVTTNIVDTHELYEYLGERTVSRLLEMCRLFHLSVDTDIRILKRIESERSR